VLIVLTSHKYETHLPIAELAQHIDDFLVIDLSDSSLKITVTKEAFILETSDGNADLLKDKCFFFPESFSLHSLRDAEDFPLDQQAIALDSWVSIWEAIEFVARFRRNAWLNSPSNSRYADNKAILNYYANANSNFRIAEALTSNDANPVIHLSSGMGLAVKAVSRKEYMDDEYLLATQYFTHDELIEHKADISSCPLLYQKFVPSPRQLRVYVFGERIFSYEIISNHGQTKPDVRVASDLEYSIECCQLDEKTSQEILSFVKNTLDIEYVALDFLTDDEGILLIDINPNGVWNWMPENSKNELDKAFISFILEFTK
jgi:hypothetical protein